MKKFIPLLLLLLAACGPTRDLSVAPVGEQSIVLWHKQTGERIDVTTRSNGHYNESAFNQIDHIFRDRHTGEEYPIDPKLIDALADLRDKLLMSPSDPIELLSGYRSPESNANLAKTNKYVAKSSFHMKGKAADIRIPEMNSSALEAVAKTMQKGGVALYPDSGHVHVDTGPIRGWSVVRGQEAGLKERSTKSRMAGRVPVQQPPVGNTVKVKPLNSYDDLPEPVSGPKIIEHSIPGPKAIGKKATPAPVSKPAPKSTNVKTTTVKTKGGLPVRTNPSPAPAKAPAAKPAAPHKKTVDEAKKQWVKTPYHAPAKATPKAPAPKKPSKKSATKDK